MTRILLVGWDPDTVDFSDPALPPGMTAEKIRAGVAQVLVSFKLMTQDGVLLGPIPHLYVAEEPFGLPNDKQQAAHRQPE